MCSFSHVAPPSTIIKPVLCNKQWLKKRDAEIRLVRYADDIVSIAGVKKKPRLPEAIKERLQAAELRLNEQKRK